MMGGEALIEGWRLVACPDGWQLTFVERGIGLEHDFILTAAQLWALYSAIAGKVPSA